MAPVTAITLPVASENAFSFPIVSSRFSSVTASVKSASTPFVFPVPSIRVRISEIFPRITVNFMSRTSSFAVFVRSPLAPAPTGSSSTTWPSTFAFFPAKNMDGIVFLFSVPMLIFNPWQIEVISSTSPESSAIIGLPPQARRIFATSFTVT